MKKQLIGVAMLLATSLLPIEASTHKTRTENDFLNNPIDYPEDYFTHHSMGCLLLQECKDGVVELTSISDLEKYYGKNYSVGEEFNQLIQILNKVGSKVYIAPSDYFPPLNRGVYHTVSNNFYLNDAFMHREGVLMSVMRHEGWHAAQDCMGGTIDNNIIAIIKPEEEVPEFWKEMVKRTYPKNVRPWEAEAAWAGRTEGMTVDALNACATGAMWTIYEPTPLTRKYLVDEDLSNS